jgi:copper transport protein
MAAPASAFAHATLLRSSPAAGAVLPTAPKVVRLVFDEVVQPAGGNEVVANAGRRSVLAGRPRTTGGVKVLVLPLRPRLAPGDYTVRWRVLSDDGHFVAGVLAFAVGAGRPPPEPVLAAGTGTPAATDVAARWLLIAGLLVAGGAALFELLVLDPLTRRLEPRARRAVERLERTRVAALVLGGSVLFIVGAARFARELGWATRFGATVRVGLFVGVAAAATAALAAFVPRARLAALGLAVALVPVPSVAGHALDAGVPWPNVIVDAAHVAAAAVWIGGLAGLLLVVPPAARIAGRGFARAIVRRVSTLALASVVILAGTGVFRAVYELHAVHQLWSTGYGRALLVKTALLGVLVLLGWANRRRLADTERVRTRVRAELLVLAGLVVAVAFLTQLRPGRAVAPLASAQPSATDSSGTIVPPPPPPRGALVLAQELGVDAVALELTPAADVVSVLAPSGGGASGLDVRVDGRATTSCGPGCYRTNAPASRPRVVRVTLGSRTAAFHLPANPQPARSTLRRATRAFLALRSVAYVERLASGPGQAIRTRWRIAAPNRLAYEIAHGSQAVVIGPHRWDRAPGGSWQRSTISPLDLPQPTWGTEIRNAYRIGGDRRTVTLAWANPSIPAYFVTRFDRRTLRPLDLRMTAAAHFMHHRYLSFNRPLGIRPPTP